MLPGTKLCWHCLRGPELVEDVKPRQQRYDLLNPAAATSFPPDSPGTGYADSHGLGLLSWICSAVLRLGLLRSMCLQLHFFLLVCLFWHRKLASKSFISGTLFFILKPCYISFLVLCFPGLFIQDKSILCLLMKVTQLFHNLYFCISTFQVTSGWSLNVFILENGPNSSSSLHATEFWTAS